MTKQKKIADIDIFESYCLLPTLYPTCDWLIAYGSTQKLGEIERQSDKMYPGVIKKIVVPYWLELVENNNANNIKLKPIFVNYLFFHICDPVNNWGVIEDLNGIAWVLRKMSKFPEPYVLKPREVISIINLSNNSLKIMDPNTYSLLNSVVIITEGLFQNFKGIVVEDGHEIKIDLLLSNKSMSIKIDRTKVAKIMNKT